MTAAYEDATDCELTIFSVTDGDTVRVFRRWEEEGDECEIGSGLIMRELRRFRDSPATHPRGLPGRQVSVDTPEKGTPDYKRATADYAAWFERYRGQIRAWVWDQGEGGFSRLLIAPYVAGDPDNTAARWMLTEANNGKGWPPYVKGV